MTDVDELRERVDGLSRLVGELAELVGQPRSERPDVMTPAWELVSSAAPPVGDTPMEDLDAWVTWAVDVYGLERWPRCWKEHTGLVVELATFRQWWAQASSSASGQSMAAWHDSWARLLARLHCDVTSIARCQRGRSHESEPPPNVTAG